MDKLNSPSFDELISNSSSFGNLSKEQDIFYQISNIMIPYLHMTSVTGSPLAWDYVTKDGLVIGLWFYIPSLSY